MMLTRSFVAVLCGALAVAALSGRSQYYPYEEFTNVPNDQWAARLDKPHPWTPPFPPPPSWDLPLPPPPSDKPPRTPPHGPPHHPKVDDKTIFQALGEDDRFSRIYKLVNYTEDITAILNDSSKSVTFFAPPDRALRPPKHHGKHKHKKDITFDEFGGEAFFTSDAVQTSDELEMFAALEGFVDDQLLQDDDDDKEHKKKIIRKILTAVLKYHIIPDELTAGELAKNTTFATALTIHDGSFHSEPLRLRVEQPPRLLKPTLSLNFYAKVLYADVKTKNGVIHVVNHPLFPPPSTFTTLFAFSDVFSTLTSAIQHAELLDHIDWHWNHHSKKLEGTPSVTVFAPTNDAFHRLPKKLKLYLFSPFGRRALKKILSYHVVPDFILFSNWAHDASGENAASRTDQDGAYSWIPNGFDVDDFDLEEEFPGGHNERESEGASSWIRSSSCDWECASQFERDGQWFPSGKHDPIHPPSDHQRCNVGKAYSPDVPPHVLHDGFLRRISAPLCPAPVSGCPVSQRRTPLHSAPAPFKPGPKHPLPHPKPKPIYTADFTLSTLLEKHSLNIHVAQFHSALPHRRFTTVVFVNGQWVIAPDVPARNGAVHVIKRLISPRGKKSGPGHHENTDDMWLQNVEEDVGSDWEDWEEWLPQWAAED